MTNSFCQQYSECRNELERARFERRMWDQHRRVDPTNPIGFQSFIVNLLNVDPDEARMRSNILKKGKFPELWDQVNAGTLTLEMAYKEVLRQRHPSPPRSPKTVVPETPKAPKKRVLKASKNENVDPDDNDTVRELKRVVTTLTALTEKLRTEPKKAPPLETHFQIPKETELKTLCSDIRTVLTAFWSNNSLNADDIKLYNANRELERDLDNSFRWFFRSLKRARGTKVPTKANKILEAFDVFGFHDVDLTKPPSWDTVKSVYRRRAAEAHPDRTVDLNNIIVLINQAYETLRRFYNK